MVGLASRFKIDGSREKIGRLGPVLIAVAAGIGLYVTPFAGIDDFNLFLLSRGLVFGIWGMGLVLLVGYTGLVSFGHAAWLAAGAYAGGTFAKEVTADILLATLVTLGITFFFAGVIGAVPSRVKGVPFAIITLAIAAVSWVIFITLPEGWMGGPIGLTFVPEPTLFGRELDSHQEQHLMIAIAATLIFLLLAFIVRTPFGGTLQAIRENELRARFIGINVVAHRWAAYVIASVASAVGGMMFVFLFGNIGPSQFEWIKSGDVLVIVLIGGIGSVYGSVLGGIAFSFVESKLRSIAAEQWQIYLGLVFIAGVLLLRGGIAGTLSAMWGWLFPTGYRQTGISTDLAGRGRMSLWEAVRKWIRGE